MLVRRRVENYLRAVLLKDALHLVIVAHRSDKRYQIQRIAVFKAQLLLDIISVVFVNIHDDYLLGAVFRDLAHQLAAYRAAAARYHAHLVADEFGYLVAVELNGLPAQKILDLDLLRLGQKLRLAFIPQKQLAQIGNNADLALGR